MGHTTAAYRAFKHFPVLKVADSVARNDRLAPVTESRKIASI